MLLIFQVSDFVVSDANGFKKKFFAKLEEVKKSIAEEEDADEDDE